MESPRKMKERQTKELMSQRYYLRAAGHIYNMGRGRGKHKTGRGGKKLWLPYVPHGMKCNKVMFILLWHPVDRSTSGRNFYTYFSFCFTGRDVQMYTIMWNRDCFTLTSEYKFWSSLMSPQQLFISFIFFSKYTTSCSFMYIYTYGVIVVVWYMQLDLQLPVQSVHITTNVASANPVYGEVYSIEHYMAKFVSDLRQVGGFLRVPTFCTLPPPIKLTATI